MIQCFKWFIYQELSGFRNHSNGTWYLSSHVINIPSLIYLIIQIKSLKFCILYFVSLVNFNLDDLIRFWSTFWSNSQMFWWQTDMWVNRPVAGISEYTSPKSHNILFCNRNACTRIVYFDIFIRCTVGFTRLVNGVFRFTGFIFFSEIESMFGIGMCCCWRDSLWFG